MFKYVFSSTFLYKRNVFQNSERIVTGLTRKLSKFSKSFTLDKISSKVSNRYFSKKEDRPQSLTAIENMEILDTESNVIVFLVFHLMNLIYYIIIFTV